ncbi:MAG: hypothetical protein WC337_01835 [Candidatus Muiribacteriota bacterium]
MNCPYCQSKIDDRAIKCPFCHSFILEKRKSAKKTILKTGTDIFKIFAGVSLALVFISVFLYFNYIHFEVKYNAKAKQDCLNNKEYINEVLQFYEIRTSEIIRDFSEDSIFKIRMVLDDKEFEIPSCPLGGEYIIYEKNKVKCSLHD